MHFLRPRHWRKQEIWQCSSVVEQRTHKPLVGGSNPPPATISPSMTYEDKEVIWWMSFLAYCATSVPLFDGFTRVQADPQGWELHAGGNP